VRRSEMATLEEAADRAAELEKLAKELKMELRDGDADFERITALAEEVSTKAARMASTFANINDALGENVAARKRSGASRRRGGQRRRKDADG
jgi:ABC-type transporter Mla subunit MlaD